MGRLQRALTSLVAAVPAALLTWLLVQVFLNHADSLNTTMKAVVGLTLLSSVMVAFMPAVLMIPGRKKTEEDSGKDSRDSNSDEDDADDGVALEDDIEVAESSDDSAEVEIGDSDVDVMVDSDDDVNTADNLSDDDLDAFDIDDEEDDPKSKKRKKKK